MTKGLILAGGAGTRLHPITKVINKHLIPIGRQPMVYYPVQTLVGSGIKEIMVVSGPESIGSIAALLGSGRTFKCNFYFRVQEKPLGISDGIRLAREFTGGDKLMVILGDNLVKETFAEVVEDFEKSSSGCRIFLKQVENVDGLGVARIEDGIVTEVIEKPVQPVSNLAVTGIYLLDNKCFDFIEDLSPSNRNELEVSSLINKYIRFGNCDSHTVAGDWLDAGRFESLREAGARFGDKQAGDAPQTQTNGGAAKAAL
jgi:glucose-1-phosphate thymidylyltransferase